MYTHVDVHISSSKKSYMNINVYSHLKSLLVAKITLNGLSCRIIRYEKEEKNSIKQTHSYNGCEHQKHGASNISAIIIILGTPLLSSKIYIYFFLYIFSEHGIFLILLISLIFFRSFSHWITTKKK